MRDKQSKKMLASAIAMSAFIAFCVWASRDENKPDASNIEALKGKLKKAVDEERYEDAAKIRDEINLKSK